MKRLRSHMIGIDQDSVLMFSDYENDGPMWSGVGTREARRTVLFKEAFLAPPSVSVGMTMWDADKGTNLRAHIHAEKVTAEGFDLVFRTWQDTRLARLRVDWMAIGALRDDDDWDIG